ncbi:MAG: ATP-binding protein, partial [Bdellovibrionota bacterium]
PVREITESVIRQLDPKRVSKKQDIQTHYGSESVLADPARLEQVLVNLVHNAIKYVPEGKKIDIFWDVAGKNTILHVKDNGPGVAPEHQSRLFERFYRVDAGRSRDMGGTGLGLAIVKHIMIKHGGQIRLVSRPGEGAEFICTFPNS